GRDRNRLRVELTDSLADRAHRAGAARGAVPAAAPKGRLHGLEFQARRHARRGHALGRDLAVAEEALAQADAAHLQALQLERHQPLADDELGAAAADVQNQAPAGLARHGVRHAGVDEPRLLHAGDDLDGVPESLTGALEKSLLAVRHAQRVGAHDPHVVGAHVPQPLAEALQTGQGARRHLLVDAAVLLDARSQTHHLAQAVDDDELAVRIARDDQVETVGAEVYRREDVRKRAGGPLRVGFLAVADGTGLTHATGAGVRGRRRRIRSRRWWRRWDCG